jgi:hypothetical protein
MYASKWFCPSDRMKLRMQFAHPGLYRTLQRRLCILFALVIVANGLASATLPAPALAQAAVQMDVQALFGGNYVRGKWLPLDIVLRNTGSAVTIVVSATIPGSTFRNTLPVELPNGAEKRVMLYAAMDDQTRELRVSAEQNGVIITEQRVEVRPRQGERLLALMSNQPLNLSLPARETLLELPFLPVDLASSTLPDQPAGLSSITLLLVSDISTLDWSEAQRRAILAWVYGGGHLVLGGGPTAARTLEGLPPELQAATVGAEQNLNATVLSEYAPDPPATLPGVLLQASSDAVAIGDQQAPLWVQRSVGNGRITQLAFNPALPEVNEWPGGSAFWNTLLRPPLLLNLGTGIETTPDYAREQTLTTALGNLPAINLPNSGPLFAVLALYTILIGPGVALILRRLDRQAAGWLVVPAVAGLVGLAAMAFASASRADQRIVTQLSLVEQLGPDTAQARTFAAMLSPQAGRYEVIAPADALVRPVRGTGGSFVDIAPAAGDLAQQSGSFAIQINPWQTEGLFAQQLVSLPALDAQLTVSEEAIQAVVRNTTGQELRDVVVVLGEQSVRIGNLAAGQQGVATWPPPAGRGAERPAIGTSASMVVLGSELAASREPGARVDRQLLIREALLSAATERGLAEAESGPFVFAWLERSPLLLDVQADGAATQEVTLLVNRPRIAGAGRAFVPPGWLRPNLAANQNSPCTGQRGRGIAASSALISVTLSLPPAMATLRAEQITLFMESERPWPNAGVTTEVFNWNENSWTALSFDGPGDLVLANAGPYMRAGQVRVRLGGRIGEANCLFIEGQVLGDF